MGILGWTFPGEMSIPLTAVTLWWSISTGGSSLCRRRSTSQPFPGWCTRGGISRKFAILPICTPNLPWPRGRWLLPYTLTSLLVSSDWSRSFVMKGAWLPGLFPRGWNYSSSWTACSDRATRSISTTRLCPWAATCMLSSWLPIPRKNWSTTISSLA